MAIVGFIVAVALGLYFLVVGAFGVYFTLVVNGNPLKNTDGRISITVAAVGVVVLILAFHYSPFTISYTGGQ